MMRVVITAGGYYYYAVWLGPAAPAAARVRARERRRSGYM
jgi:hypothetical protein